MGEVYCSLDLKSESGDRDSCSHTFPMSASSTQISPFAKSIPPPRPLVVLLRSTTLHIDPAPPLLAHQDIPIIPAGRSSSNPHSRSFKTHRPHPYRSPTPQRPAPRSETLPIASPLSSPSPSPVSSTTTTNQGESQKGPEIRRVTFGRPAITTRLTISRPTGAGRRNLNDLVNWDSNLSELIKVCS